MNEFLKSMAQIDQTTKYLQDNGLLESGLSCKNWEAAQVIPFFKDGNWLDMGSDGGIILENLLRKKIGGLKYGIDLAYHNDVVSPEGLNLIKGDLMNTGLPDECFDYVSSLSVIEHEVDFSMFAKEVSRLLKVGGQLFISFDYALKKIDTSLTKLYSLSWNVLSKQDAERLVIVCAEHGLVISGEIDWTLQDMVINPQYCSPANCEYTFGIFQFIKQ